MLCYTLFKKHDIIRQSIYTWLWFFPLWLNLSPQPLPMLTHRLLAATTVYACNECREIFKHKQLSVNKVLHCHIYRYTYTCTQFSVLFFTMVSVNSQKIIMMPSNNLHLKRILNTFSYISVTF